ncbi:MAG: hypothetical protein LBR10_13335 [Prevotellaceae bacterium]|jgi:hypothetical protein|nr:hypothetical protein [Prevotellaceae bacterium]
MIKPHKYLDLNLSLLNMGGVILNIIKETGVIKYDELLNRVILSRGNNATEVFIPTLGFLYIMGKIDYKKDIDIIEYIQ